MFSRNTFTSSGRRHAILAIAILTTASTPSNVARAASVNQSGAVLASESPAYRAAQAGAVTAPSGTSQLYNSPLTVNWNGIAFANGVAKPVDIALVVGHNNGLAGVVTSVHNIANNGHSTLPLPAGGCHELPRGYYYQILVQAVLYQTGADWGVSAPFRFKCRHVGADAGTPKMLDIASLPAYRGHAQFGPAAAVHAPTATGNFSVMKQVHAPAGAPIPASFAITTTCTPYPLSYPVANHTANDGIGGPMPAPNNCTVTEAQLAPVGHVQACNGGSASWTASITPAQPVTVVPNAWTYVTVTNTLACEKPAHGGHVTVHKTVVNATGGPVASMPPMFNVSVNCTPSGPLGTMLHVPANGGVSLAASVLVNSTCSLHEQHLSDIPNLPQCKGATAYWTTDYSPGVVIQAGATSTMTVRNTLTCNKPPPTGSLRTIKSVNNMTGAPVSLPATFPMHVSCLPSGPAQQAFAVPPGGTGVTTGNIAAPASCTVTEDSLTTIQHVEGCHGGSASWTTLMSPSQPASIAANATTTVSVRNTLTCDKPAATGSLEVIKRIIRDSTIPPPDVDFYVDVACQPGGPHTVVRLGSENAYRDRVTGIAIGGDCTITEQPPAVPADLARRGCRWETSYPDGQRIPVSLREGAKGVVVNRWICKDGGGTGDGTYDIGIKKTTSSTWSSGSPGLFNLAVTNNGAAIAPPMTITATDTLPASLTLVGAAGAGWSCGATNPVVCTYSGAVPAGQALPPIVITVLAIKDGLAKNSASIVLNGAQDSVANNNTSGVGLHIGPAAHSGGDGTVTPYGSSSRAGVDVGITNTITSGTLREDGIGTFELTVTNHGAPLKESANLMLHDMLPSGLVLQSATPAGSAMHCKTTASDVLCRVMGDFPSGAQARLRVNVRALRKGTFNNCASVRLVAATDRFPGNNTACVMLRAGLDATPGRTMPPALIVPPQWPKQELKPKLEPKPKDDHYDVPKGP